MLKRWWYGQKNDPKNKWLNLYQQRFNVPSLSVSQQDVQQWFASDLGQRLLAQEQHFIDELLPELFGYYLMQLSVLGNNNLVKSSSTSVQFALCPSECSIQPIINRSSESRLSFAVSEFEQLAIDSNDIDVALLHHALDFSSNPHQLLRETARSIIPNGHIVVVGFNPFSLLGLRHRLASLFSRSYAYRHQYLRASRLRDWCKVLDLEIVYSKKGYYSLPFQRDFFTGLNGKWLNKLGQTLLPWSGGFYTVVIRKNVTPARLIKVDWKRKHSIGKWGKRMIAPSSSSASTSISICTSNCTVDNAKNMTDQ